MTLQEVIEREKDFKRFGRGNWDSLSIRDVDNETLQVVKIDETDKIKAEYLNAKFLSVGGSAATPTRLRIRINYDLINHEDK